MWKDWWIRERLVDQWIEEKDETTHAACNKTLNFSGWGQKHERQHSEPDSTPLPLFLRTTVESGNGTRAVFCDAETQQTKYTTQRNTASEK